MLIRGSEGFTIFFIISVIFAITSTILSFIDNEICQMLAGIFAVISAVTGVLNIALNFGSIIQSFRKKTNPYPIFRREKISLHEPSIVV